MSKININFNIEVKSLIQTRIWNKSFDELAKFIKDNEISLVELNAKYKLEGTKTAPLASLMSIACTSKNNALLNTLIGRRVEIDNETLNILFRSCLENNRSNKLEKNLLQIIDSILLYAIDTKQDIGNCILNKSIDNIYNRRNSRQSYPQSSTNKNISYFDIMCKMKDLNDNTNIVLLIIDHLLHIKPHFIEQIKNNYIQDCIPEIRNHLKVLQKKYKDNIQSRDENIYQSKYADKNYLRHSR